MRRHAPRPPLLHATLAVLPLLLLLLLVAHGVTPSAAAAGSDEKSSVCAGVDASLAELRSVVADLSSLITHTSITPITSSSSSRRSEEGWEDDAGLEMDEYSVQLRVRLPRAVAKTGNTAQGKVQHERSHNRNQSRTIITSSSPPSSRQQLPSRAAVFLRKLISGSTITIDSSGAGRARAVEELLGSLLAPLQRSLSPLCAESEEGGHGNSNNDEGEDEDEQPQPEFVVGTDSDQHKDTHGLMAATGGMDSSQAVQFPHLMPDFSTVALSRDHSELQRALMQPIEPSSEGQLRSRRETSPSSYECSLSALIEALLRRQQQQRQHQAEPPAVFDEACRVLDGTEPIFNGIGNAVFLSVIIDRQSDALTENALALLDMELSSVVANSIHFSIAVGDWRGTLLLLLRDIHWPEWIGALIIDSDVPATLLQPGSLPANALQRFPFLQHFFFSHPGLIALPSGIFNGLQAMLVLQVSDTQIDRLPDGIFLPLSSLVTLRLINNPLATLQEGIFDGLARLRSLRIERTQLTQFPAHASASFPLLLFMFTSNNNFEGLAPSFFMDLAHLEVLDLSSNQLTALPEHLPESFSHLRHLDLRHNRLQALPMDIFPRLRGIESLLLSNVGTNVRLPAVDLGHLERPRILHLTNVTIDGDAESVFVLKADSWNLTALAVGWEGLRANVLTIPTMCNVLDDNADLLSITHSSYEAFKACEGKSISSLVLANDKRLMAVTLGDHNRLDVAYSSSLTTLTATGRIPTVDVSGTNLPYSTLFCDQLGSSQFIARQMLNIELLEPELLLRQCFIKGSIFDFSKNAHSFFGQPSGLSRVIPTRVVFGTMSNQHLAQYFEDTGEEPELFRSSIPSFLFDADGVVCSTEFEPVPLFTLDILPEVTVAVTPVLTFTTSCACTEGFNEVGGVCIPPERPDVAGITTGALAGFAVLVAIPVLIYRHKRRKRERALLLENELQEQLLTESNQDVAALKQGWQISLDEVHLINKVDEGAFGAVWRGDWEGVAVAVKFLKLASFGMVDYHMLRDIEKEVDFLQRTRHTNLVRFFGTGTDRHGAPFLVLEFVDLGSLKHLLHESGLDSAISQVEAQTSIRANVIPAEDADSSLIIGARTDALSATSSATFALRVKSAASLKLCLVRDIVDGMAFLHSLDVMHRDLKSGNVLVNKRLVAKITDFGSMSGKLSRIQQEAATDSNTHASAPVAETQLEYSPESMNKTVCLTMTDGVGTPLYMAPEILDPQLRKLSLKADVFSFGVLMWEISECRVPDLLAQEFGDDFSGFVEQTLLQLYRDGKHLHFGDIDDDGKDKDSEKKDDDGPSSSSSSCPMWYQTLSLLCMSFSPSDRPSFEQIRAELGNNQ